jgi:hypothetical protein
MYKDSGSLFSVVHNALMLPIHVHINTSYPVSSVCFNPSRSNINLSTFNNPRHQGDFARLSNEGETGWAMMLFQHLVCAVFRIACTLTLENTRLKKTTSGNVPELSREAFRRDHHHTARVRR